MKKLSLSVTSLLLFIIPVVTLIVCIQIHILHYDLRSISFIDGEVSISLIGRQVKTIGIFRAGFFLYMFFSIFFYLKISEYFLLKGFKNRFKFYGLLANFFLCIYILALGRDGTFYENARRLAIILYIASMYINHIYVVKIFRLLKFKKKTQLSITYLRIFYVIIALMTILVIIGSPWVNPLFDYPNQLKNIIEWNYFLLTIVFYIPLSFLFYKLKI